jgi:predicted amino acid dehydrogenase
MPTRAQRGETGSESTPQDHRRETTLEKKTVALIKTPEPEFLDPSSGVRRLTADRETQFARPVLSGAEGQSLRDLTTAPVSAPETRVDSIDVAIVIHPRSTSEAVSVFPWLDGLGDVALRDLLQFTPPALIERVHAATVRTGIIAAPVFADELRYPHQGARDPRRAIAEALALGAKLGARTVVLDALSAYALENGTHELTAAAAGSARVTTGHALATFTILKTLEQALAASRRSLAGRTVAVLGLGPTGAATARALSALPSRPGRILLCDIEAQRARATEVAAELRSAG